ncbi:MAG: HAMP domain-containing protein [Actinomycetota bacterium]
MKTIETERAERRETPAPASRSSIRLPIAVGAVLFGLFALAVPTLLGFSSQREGEVPPALVDQLETSTIEAAQSLRTSLNEGVYDLMDLAGLLEVAPELTGERLQQAVSKFALIHDRYESVYVLDPARKVLALEGGEPAPALIPDAAFKVADIAQADLSDRLRIPMFASMRRCEADTRPVDVAKCPRRAVVGHYSPSYLLSPLSLFKAGQAWVLDQDSMVLASHDPAEAGRDVEDANIKQAVSRVRSGETGAYLERGVDGRLDVIGYAPIVGFGPSGDLGWGIVASRPVELDTGGSSRQLARSLALGTLGMLLVLIVFGWLYRRVVHPIDRLEVHADGLAHGATDIEIDFDRRDEVGSIAISLERIRRAIRHQGSAADGSTSLEELLRSEHESFWGEGFWDRVRSDE